MGPVEDIIYKDCSLCLENMSCIHWPDNEHKAASILVSASSLGSFNEGEKNRARYIHCLCIGQKLQKPGGLKTKKLSERRAWYPLFAHMPLFGKLDSFVAIIVASS